MTTRNEIFGSPNKPASQKQSSKIRRSDGCKKKKFQTYSPNDDLHQGKSTWHRSHVLSCIGLYKPYTNPPFGGLCHVFLPSGSSDEWQKITQISQITCKTDARNQPGFHGSCQELLSFLKLFCHSKRQIDGIPLRLTPMVSGRICLYIYTYMYMHHLNIHICIIYK